jgi:hypothetical protein
MISTGAPEPTVAGPRRTTDRAQPDRFPMARPVSGPQQVMTVRRAGAQRSPFLRVSMSSVRANVVDRLLRRRPPEVSCMNESTRPKRVVVVDAENPLVEISGDFYWLEDHERIVAQARESA